MKISTFVASALLTFGALTAPVQGHAATTDADGYPIFYLRGDFAGGSWNATNLEFSRDGNDYSFHINELDGQFKISNDDWTLNYGSQHNEDPSINASTIRTGIFDGPNFKGENLKDVTITFTFVKDSPTAEIKFVVNGQQPIEPPTPSVGSGTLPILYINVFDEYGNLNNEIISKDLAHKNYFTGEYWLDLNGCEWMEAEGAKSIGSKDEPLPLQIKARGNWTRRGFAKKPFKLKLDKKQSMLGLSKSKHFAILAHADDQFGYMRNFTGFNLGRRMELPWTPDQQPVEVVINGDYRGLYFLTESIRIDSDRVNITELDDNVTDPALISGGYLVELDNYDEDNQIRMEEKGQAGGFKDMLRITFDTPEVYSDIQRQFVTEQFTAMNDAIGDNSDRLWSYMDLDDAARYYIVEEIISHTEAYHGSTYLFRDRGEGQKWHFSPLWDCGNAFMGPSDHYFSDFGPFGNTWIASMRMNAKFMDKVKDTWKWFMANNFDGLYEDLDRYADHLKEAAKADYERWNGKPYPDGGQPVIDNRDMDRRKQTVKNHLKDKINWLRQQWGDFNGYYAEPERDTTPAAPLPEYVISGLDNIYDIESEETPAEIYNLQGMKITTPQPGDLYIIRKGQSSKTRLAK
ncbi:MAG: CotH kinase family protein [Muribaculaceae bacterium]|nr:CotH kinase family protein [Muribaculaceae bacterium]